MKLFDYIFHSGYDMLLRQSISVVQLDAEVWFLQHSINNLISNGKCFAYGKFHALVELWALYIRLPCKKGENMLNHIGDARDFSN